MLSKGTSGGDSRGGGADVTCIESAGNESDRPFGGRRKGCSLKARRELSRRRGDLCELRFVSQLFLLRLLLAFVSSLS